MLPLFWASIPVKAASMSFKASMFPLRTPHLTLPNASIAAKSGTHAAANASDDEKSVMHGALRGSGATKKGHAWRFGMATMAFEAACLPVATAPLPKKAPAMRVRRAATRASGLEPALRLSSFRRSTQPSSLYLYVFMRTREFRPLPYAMANRQSAGLVLFRSARWARSRSPSASRFSRLRWR